MGNDPRSGQGNPGQNNPGQGNPDQRLTLVGDAWEVQMSDERRSVLEAFRANGNRPMRVSEIAARVDKTEGVTKTRLYKMVKDGDLAVEKGVFRLLPEGELPF